MKVSKFGGSSLADAGQIRKVCDIVCSDDERRIVVVSAPGKRYDDDKKMTDMLICAANTALAGGGEAEIEAVVDRFAGIASDLGVAGVIDEITDNLHALLSLDRSRPGQLTDTYKAAGEDNCARVVTAYLQSMGVNAHYVNPGDAGMILEGPAGEAQVVPESYILLKDSLLRQDGVIVFPGFFGRTRNGDCATFPRGGSDITGAILAAAVGADVYENFTDVDYVYAINPKLADNPRPIRNVTYREMRELSYAGFNVYQEEALLPVVKAGIPVNIRNANNPSCPGTLIVSRRPAAEYPIAGIASENDFSCIYISKYLMNREIGFGRKIMSILEEAGISYEHMPTGIDDMSVIIRDGAFGGTSIETVANTIERQLHTDPVSFQRGLSLVVVVGEGMRHAIGIASRATAALSQAGVNIEMISQGSSEVSMIFAVARRDCERAVKALYMEFFEYAE